MLKDVCSLLEIIRGLQRIMTLWLRNHSLLICFNVAARSCEEKQSGQQVFLGLECISLVLPTLSGAAEQHVLARAVPWGSLHSRSSFPCNRKDTEKQAL